MLQAFGGMVVLLVGLVFVEVCLLTALMQDYLVMALVLVCLVMVLLAVCLMMALADAMKMKVCWMKVSGLVDLALVAVHDHLKKVFEWDYLVMVWA